LRGYEVIHFVLTETSTADQTWLQQVVIKNSRPFRALQLQVKKGERETENERERKKKRKKKNNFFFSKNMAFLKNFLTFLAKKWLFYLDFGDLSRFSQIGSKIFKFF
jgi:hypothetical protein